VTIIVNKIRSTTRIRFSFYRALRSEGLGVKQAWKAAGDAVKYTDAMFQAMMSMPGYDIINRLYKRRL